MTKKELKQTLLDFIEKSDNTNVDGLARTWRSVVEDIIEDLAQDLKIDLYKEDK